MAHIEIAVIPPLEFVDPISGIFFTHDDQFSLIPGCPEHLPKKSLKELQFEEELRRVFLLDDRDLTEFSQANQLIPF